MSQWGRMEDLMYDVLDDCLDEYHIDAVDLSRAVEQVLDIFLACGYLGGVYAKQP